MPPYNVYEAAKFLQDDLRREWKPTAFAVGTDTVGKIVVYLFARGLNWKNKPTEYKGYSVEFKYVGKVRPATR